MYVNKQTPCQLTRIRQDTPGNSTHNPMKVLSPGGCLKDPGFKCPTRSEFEGDTEERCEKNTEVKNEDDKDEDNEDDLDNSQESQYRQDTPGNSTHSPMKVLSPGGCLKDPGFKCPTRIHQRFFQRSGFYFLFLPVFVIISIFN
jgi:hypothetical protein